MDRKIRELSVNVTAVRKIKSDVFCLSFVSPHLAKNSLPGQFLHVYPGKTVLRRPFSVHKVDKDTVGILFRIKGKGTEVLSAYRKGDILNVIGPLGNGFSCGKSGELDILAAGGIGVAPLLFLAETLAKNKKPIVILGAKNKTQILCEKEFNDLGCEVFIATEDGSRGKKGTVVELLKDIIPAQNGKSKVNIYACGPAAMFFEASKVIPKNIDCQVSFEQFMGCGIGTCCSCIVETKQGYRKVCKDGPVFNIKDIW